MPVTNPIRKCWKCSAAFFSEKSAKSCNECRLSVANRIAKSYADRKGYVRRPSVEFNCEHCGEHAVQWSTPGNSGRFCSRKCAAQARMKRRAEQAKRENWWKGVERQCQASAKAVSSGVLKWIESVQRAENPATWKVRPCLDCGSDVRRSNRRGATPELCVVCRRRKENGSEWNKASKWRRKTRERQAGLTKASKKRIWERDNWLCYICGCVVEPWSGKWSPTMATVDHVVPLADGGEHTDANCRTACSACNSSKSDRTELMRDDVSTHRDMGRVEHGFASLP